MLCPEYNQIQVYDLKDNSWYLKECCRNRQNQEEDSLTWYCISSLSWYMVLYKLQNLSTHIVKHCNNIKEGCCYKRMVLLKKKDKTKERHIIKERRRRKSDLWSFQYLPKLLSKRVIPEPYNFLQIIRSIMELWKSQIAWNLIGFGQWRFMHNTFLLALAWSYLSSFYQNPLAISHDKTYFYQIRALGIIV